MKTSLPPFNPSAGCVGACDPVPSTRSLGPKLGQELGQEAWTNFITCFPLAKPLVQVRPGNLDKELGQPPAALLRSPEHMVTRQPAVVQVPWPNLDKWLCKRKTRVGICPSSLSKFLSKWVSGVARKIWPDLTVVREVARSTQTKQNYAISKIVQKQVCHRCREINAMPQTIFSKKELVEGPASEAPPGSCPAALQLLACPPRCCRCPGAPAAPTSAGSPGPRCSGRSWSPRPAAAARCRAKG